MLQPKRRQNLIVGIKKDYKFRWYIMPASLTFLNLEKLPKSTLDYYMSHPSFKNIREDCLTLSNEVEIKNYISGVSALSSSTEQLSNMLAHASKSLKSNFADDFCPSLYINFDEKTLFYSNDEFALQSKCLPSGFGLKKINFLELIPRKHQFWKLL